MKKWLITILCLSTVTFIFIWYNTALINPIGIVKSYNTEWGIDLPEPEKMEEVWGSEVSFQGDGEWFNVFQYSESKISINDSGMIALSTDNIAEAENQIDHFINTTISMYQFQGNEKVKEAFANYPVKPNVGDFYFYREENDEFDYFIALFKKDENKLYTFEWHQ